MSAIVKIADDPSAEGGHALIHVQGAAGVPSTGTLIIEVLTEGFDYRGPRRLDVSPLGTEHGFDISIGPDVVAALRQGLAVNLRLDGAGLNVDVLWPALTPPRAVARRSALSNTKPKRRVVAGEESSSIAPRRTPKGTSTIETEPFDETPPDSPRLPEPKVEPKESVPLIVVEPRDPEQIVEEPKAPSTPSTPPDTVPVRAAGWSRPRVAAVGLVAFFLGAGSMALLQRLMPAPKEQPIEAKADIDFASPYDLLADLPPRSPDGVTVKAGESHLFRTRAQSAGSGKEADFWHLWALHASLESRMNNLAGVLGDFATVMANTHRSDGDIAAARVVWELAAIGRDCNAMDNLAATYSMMGPPDKPTPVLANHKTGDRTSTVTTWHRRADECREHALSKP